MAPHAPRPAPHAIQSILVPTDFGTSADVALGHAIATAERLDAKIDVLHVWSHLPKPVAGIAFELAGQPPRTVHRITQNNARVKLEGYLEEHRKRSKRIDESFLLEGDAAETIVDVARKGSYDLLIMGTRARRGIARILTGSIAEKVMRHAPCPILVVPRGAAQRRIQS